MLHSEFAIETNISPVEQIMSDNPTRALIGNSPRTTYIYPSKCKYRNINERVTVYNDGIDWKWNSGEPGSRLQADCAYLSERKDHFQDTERRRSRFGGSTLALLASRWAGHPSLHRS
jgi:hypothetical protein